MKKVLFFILTVSVALSVNAQKTPKATKSTAPVFKSLLDSFSYAAGINVAKNMRAQGIAELNSTLMYNAIDDVFKNKPSVLSDELVNGSLQRQLDIFAKNKSAAEKARGIAFLDSNKKIKGVIVLPDGLQYQVIKDGDSTANRPAAVDTVIVNYIGTLVDGTEFDNSYKRGQPLSRHLNGVVRGWSEVLQLMRVGSHWKVFIPSELAYGEGGGGGGVVPPNAVLIFDMVLEGIKPAVK